jgi:hypothetical protein
VTFSPDSPPKIKLNNTVEPKVILATKKLFSSRRSLLFVSASAVENETKPLLILFSLSAPLMKHESKKSFIYIATSIKQYEKRLEDNK